MEVELRKKPGAEYERILRWYAAELVYRRVVWFAGAEPVRRRLEDLVERERLGDFMRVEPLPPAITVQQWGQ